MPPVYGASFILADPNGVPQLDEHWFVVQDYPHHKMKHGDWVVGYGGIRASQSSLAALKKHQQAKLKDPNAVMTYSFVKKNNLKDLTPLMSHKPTKSYGYCYKVSFIGFPMSFGPIVYMYPIGCGGGFHLGDRDKVCYRLGWKVHMKV